MTTSTSSRLRAALLVSSLARAGAEKQFVYIARCLFEAGIDARVFYFGSGGYYEQALRDMGIPLTSVYWPGERFKILFGLIRSLRKFQPQIVLASEFGDAIHAGLVGRLCGALTLAGVRSDAFWEMRTCGRRSWWMRRLPHGLLANSFRARQNLISLGIRAEKLDVLTNVIDLEEFDALSTRTVAAPARPDRIVVAAIGRLHYVYKRFDRVIKALARARTRVPTLIGVIVGKDEGAKSRLEEQARALGLLPEHLVFLGESAEVPALLQRVHMLVLSSDYEGFPNVVLEAMAAGRPIITTPVGDAPRLVEHERTGYVVDFDDHAAMAESMVRLAQSPPLRTRFGEAGRQRVERDYDYQGLRGRLMDVLARFAEQQGRVGLLRLLTDERFPAAERHPSGLDRESFCIPLSRNS